MIKMIQVNNLIKKYKGITAIRDLSFFVNEGEIYGLLGPNGAGKSTTLNIISTLIEFDSGTVEVGGLDIIKCSKEVKKMVGVVPQDLAVYQKLTAFENAEFFARLYGMPKREAKKAAEEALAFVGLDDKQKIYPTRMSGGMKRRLNIACGIVHTPKLIIMDEPTVGVDAQSRDSILQTIKMLNQRGSTIIYTSHYMQEVEEICDRIGIVDKGQLIVEGTLHELIATITHMTIFTIQVAGASSINKNILIEKVKRCAGVKDTTFEGDLLKVSLDIYMGNINKILECLLQEKIVIQGIKDNNKNLEDVFLSFTGEKLA